MEETANSRCEGHRGWEVLVVSLWEAADLLSGSKGQKWGLPSVEYTPPPNREGSAFVPTSQMSKPRSSYS